MNRAKQSSPTTATTTDEPTRPPAKSSQNKRRYIRPKSLWQQPLFWIGSISLSIMITVSIFIIQANRQQMAAVIGPTDPSVLHAITSISAQRFNDVGTAGLSGSLLRPMRQLPILTHTATTHKPEIFYYGAEYCPFCAAERWPLVAALSRFGTFTRLPETASSSTDTDPNTATFSFMGSQYSSPYIDFIPIEATDRQNKPLQTPGAAEQQILKKYRVSGFPFIDIGDQFYVNGPQFGPELLSNLSQRDIIKQLADSNSTISQNIIGSANYLVTAICTITNNQPAKVCQQDPIPSIRQRLPAAATTLPTPAVYTAQKLPAKKP